MKKSSRQNELDVHFGSNPDSEANASFSGFYGARQRKRRISIATAVLCGVVIGGAVVMIILYALKQSNSPAPTGYYTIPSVTAGQSVLSQSPRSATPQQASSNPMESARQQQLSLSPSDATYAYWMKGRDIFKKNLNIANLINSPGIWVEDKFSHYAQVVREGSDTLARLPTNNVDPEAISLMKDVEYLCVTLSEFFAAIIRLRSQYGDNIPQRFFNEAVTLTALQFGAVVRECRKKSQQLSARYGRDFPLFIGNEGGDTRRNSGSESRSSRPIPETQLQRRPVTRPQTSENPNYNDMVYGRVYR